MLLLWLLSLAFVVRSRALPGPANMMFVEIQMHLCQLAFNLGLFRFMSFLNALYALQVMGVGLQPAQHSLGGKVHVSFCSG